jgi:DME family drug/metabolite transporter
VTSALRPVLAVVAAAALFGTAGTALELGPDSATPLGVGAVRISIGVVVLWAAIAVGEHRSTVIPAVRANWPMMLLGGAGVAAYTPSFFEAVERTGVAVGTVVTIGSGPFFAGALEWAWRGVRPTGGWLVGTIVTVTGGVVLVVAQSGDTSDAVSVDGVAFALLAGAGYALYSVTSKTTMARGVDPTLALAGAFSVGVVAVALLAAREPYGWLTTGSGALMAVHLGVAATGVAYLLFGYGLHRLTTATTVTLVLAEPLTATLLAVLVLDESLTAVAWVGVGVLLAGLVIVGRTARVGIEPVPPTPLGSHCP